MSKSRLIKPTQTVAELVRHHMNEIADLFDVPKVTLVVRSPTLDGDLIFTNDDPEQTIVAIKKMTVLHAPVNVIRPN